MEQIASNASRYAPSEERLQILSRQLSSSRRRRTDFRYYWQVSGHKNMADKSLILVLLGHCQIKRF